MPSEYEKYEMAYGKPRATGPADYSQSLALLEGDRILGGMVHGAGLAQIAKDRASAGAMEKAGGGGAGGGGKGGSNLRNSVLSEAQRQYEAALAANQKTEAELKEGYADRRLKAEKSLEKTGAQAKADVNAHFDKLVAAARAQMNASGIGQTSIATTTIAGIEKERAKALANLYDQQTMQKVGLDTQLSADELQLAERVQNEYPDMNAILDGAKLEGEGSQTGMAGGGFGGVGGAYGIGMGGAASIGTPYGINPFGFGFSYPQPAASGGTDSRGLTAAQREANRQASYAKNRAGNVAPIQAAPIAAPVQAPTPMMQLPSITMPSIPQPATGAPSPTLKVPSSYAPGNMTYSSPYPAYDYGGAYAAGGGYIPEFKQNDRYKNGLGWILDR